MLSLTSTGQSQPCFDPTNADLLQLLVQTEGAKPKRLAKPDPARLRQGGEEEEGGEGGREGKRGKGSEVEEEGGET